jgi:hypothetical protein
MAMPAGVRINLVERAGLSPHGQAARAATRGAVHEEALIGILEVVACHMITDAADFFAQVVVQDLKVRIPAKSAGASGRSRPPVLTEAGRAFW